MNDDDEDLKWIFATFGRTMARLIVDDHSRPCKMSPDKRARLARELEGQPPHPRKVPHDTHDCDACYEFEARQILAASEKQNAGKP